MNSHGWRILKVAAWLVTFLFLIVLIVLPTLTAILISYDRLPNGYMSYLSVIEDLQSWAMRVFIVAWVFFTGSCFASFFNVVAWRVPRGRSILGVSHCPQCDTPLKFRDNMPIVGWIRNRGRCRNCRTSISPRYLIAELILGSLFLLVVSAELMGGGWNLPFRFERPSAAFETLLVNPPWDRVGVVVYHLILVSALFTFALIESDGHRVPGSVAMTYLGLGIVLPLIQPDLLIRDWKGQNAAETLHGLGPDTGITLAAGGVSGWVIGWLLSVTQKHFSGFHQKTFEVFKFNLLIGLMVVGVFLGWHSALATGVLMLLIFSVREWLPDVTNGVDRNTTFGKFQQFVLFNQSSLLLVATVVHLLTWRWQWMFLLDF